MDSVSQGRNDNMNENIYIGDLIKESRHIRNMNQEELANIIGCSLNTVSRWENNHYVPSLPDIQKISEVLGVRFSIQGNIIRMTIL